jgi:PAS domain S-box-containing protein
LCLYRFLVNSYGCWHLLIKHKKITDAGIGIVYEPTIWAFETICFSGTAIIIMNSSLLNNAQVYLDFAGAIIVAINPDESIRFINKKGCQVLGCTRDAVVGKNWFDHFVPAEKKQEGRNVFNALLQQTFPEEYYENTLLTEKGEIRYIKWQNTIIRNDDGAIAGMFSSGEDITENKLLLKRLADQEKQKRKQLIAAVLQAQEKERSEIAHELHDNINQILTTCKLLLEQEVYLGNHSPLVSNTFKHIQTAIQEIRNLSHSLNPADLKDINFEGAVRELTHKVKLTRKFDIALTFNGGDYIHEVDAAIAVSLYRIIQEQLTNIIKHADATTIDIVVEATANSIDLEVMDNGKGYQVKSVKKGLGLKSIYSRAELHNGKVYISSAPGEGCTLSVCIPLHF